MSIIDATLIPVAAGVVQPDGTVEIRAALADELSKRVRPGVGLRLLVTVSGKGQESVGVSLADVQWDPGAPSGAGQRGAAGAWRLESTGDAESDAARRAASGGEPIPETSVAFTPIEAPKASKVKALSAPIPSGWSCSGAVSAPTALSTSQWEVTGYVDNVLTNVTETMSFRSSQTSSSTWGFKAGVGAGPLTVGGETSFEQSVSNSVGQTAIFNGWQGHYQQLASVNETRHALWTVSQCVYSTSKYPPPGTTTQSLTIVGPYKMEWHTGYVGGDVAAFTQSAPFTQLIGASQTLKKSSSVTNRNSTGVSVNLTGAIPGGGTLSGGISYTATNVAGAEVERAWTTHGYWDGNHFHNKYLGSWGGNPLTTSDVHMQLWDAG